MPDSSPLSPEFADFVDRFKLKTERMQQGTRYTLALAVLYSCGGVSMLSALALWAYVHWTAT